MKVKVKRYKQLRLLQNIVHFGGKRPSTLVISTAPDKTNAVYIGPRSGAGWVEAQRLKRQGIPVEVDDTPAPF